LSPQRMHISQSVSLMLQCTRASLSLIKGSVTMSPIARKSTVYSLQSTVVGGKN